MAEWSKTEVSAGRALLREDDVAAVMDLTPFLTVMADTKPCDLKVCSFKTGFLDSINERRLVCSGAHKLTVACQLCSTRAVQL